MVTVHGVICNTKTFPTSCRYCSASIYFFMCDCGSKVFFDDLGPPWPLHDCYYGGAGGSQGPNGPSNNGPSFWRALPGISIIRGGPRRDGLLPGLRRGTDSIDSTLIKRVRESTNQQREIMRIEPLSEGSVEIVGVLRESASPDLAKRYNLPRTSIGFDQLSKRIGDSDPVQLTVHVDELAADPAAIDFMSYTFLAPRRGIARRLRQGNVLQVRLIPIETIGVGRLWKATSIECLF